MSKYIKEIDITNKQVSFVDRDIYPENGFFILKNDEYRELVLVVKEIDYILYIHGWDCSYADTNERGEKIMFAIENTFIDPDQFVYKGPIETINVEESKSLKTQLESVDFTSDQKKVSEDFVLKLVELITRKK